MDFIKKLNRTRIVIAIIVVLLFIFGAYKISTNNADKNSSPSSTSASTQNISIAPSGIKYPAGWQEDQQIPQADKDDGVVSEAGRDNPNASVVVRIVNGPLDKSFDIKALPDQTVASLREGLSGFSLVSKSLTSIGKHQAVEVTYKGGSGENIYENTTIIVPTDNKTFYITFAAKPTDFAKIANDIKAIETAVLPYIDSHLET